MMPNSDLSVSAKNDVVPDWTSKEVSTGVSLQFTKGLDRTEHSFVPLKHLRELTVPE